MERVFGSTNFAGDYWNKFLFIELYFSAVYVFLLLIGEAIGVKDFLFLFANNYNWSISHIESVLSYLFSMQYSEIRGALPM
jgi:hypothetical protein